ncbi:uncharacterized protein BKA78DRAFT_317613 [Phyllosticta capitalensis]|uniref:uncharacterized protein n=1 Tax=Phyllosticta capitalensis TaxID=121624 RepID=UPI00312FE1F5
MLQAPLHLLHLLHADARPVVTTDQQLPAPLATPVFSTFGRVMMTGCRVVSRNQSLQDFFALSLHSAGHDTLHRLASATAADQQQRCHQPDNQRLCHPKRPTYRLLRFLSR